MGTQTARIEKFECPVNSTQITLNYSKFVDLMQTAGAAAKLQEKLQGNVK